MNGPDRTPKPCLHKRANHQHGDRATYVLDRCRCLPCAHAASVYNQQLNRRNAYGRSNYIDATPARERVAALMAAGVGLKRIVVVSGVSQGVLWKLMYGKNGGTPSRRVTRVTAARLLALSPDDRSLLADGVKVDATGTVRRLQALACLGWSVARLASEGGLDRQALDGALHGRQVLAATARAVAALYERFWDRRPEPVDRFDQGGITRTINAATRAGWTPPLAWDDDAIDDPAAAPHPEPGSPELDEHAVELVLDGQPMSLTGRDLEVAALRLIDRGLDYAAIAVRCRSDETTVRRVLNTARQRLARAAAREAAA